MARARILLLIALLTLFAAACDSSESSDKADDGSSGGQAQNGAGPSRAGSSHPSPLETVQVAYKKTTAAETSKVAYEGVMTGVPDPSGKPTTMRYTGEGVMDYAGEEMAMTMRMPMFGEMEVRSLGSTMYMRFPKELSGQMFGKPWAKMDMDKIAKEEFGASFSEMQGTSATPEEQLGYLRGASDSVKKLGEETVRGTPTTHYRAVVDLEKAAAAEENPRVQRAYEKTDEQIGTTKMPTEVWLDEEDRVRRMEITVPLSNAAAGADVPEDASQDARMTMVYEYYDFGAPVRVVAPPADQTVDITDMATQQRTRAT